MEMGVHLSRETGNSVLLLLDNFGLDGDLGAEGGDQVTELLELAVALGLEFLLLKK